jgi:DNA-binding NarL/FixJ family response regulator
VPCGGSGWRPVSPDPERRRRAAADQVTYRLPGSYGELEWALRALPAAARRAVVAFSVRGDQARPWLVVAGLELVSRRMPARIRVAAGVLEAWQAREQRRWQLAGPRRDEQIRRLAAEGESVTRIAARARLTERHVRRIVNGR